MKIEDSILDILADCTVNGDVVFLPNKQLDRKTYEAVNRVLEMIGGKWNKKAKGHVFDYDPSDEIDMVVSSGEVENRKKMFQFFPTPSNIAELMCDIADLNSTSVVLEPSCGGGALMDVIYARGVKFIFGVELNEDMKKYLVGKPYTTQTGVDFLDFVYRPESKEKWTHIIMNPPFTKQQDVDHILAAWSILPDGGTLVSVVSPSPFFRTNNKSIEFREWLSVNAVDVIDIPAGMFKDSGTMIATKVIKATKSQ